MSSTSTTSEPSAAEKEMIFAGRFTGKAVVVTGAAQGIGRTVARRIAGEGGKLALVDRAPLVGGSARGRSRRRRSNRRHRRSGNFCRGHRRDQWCARAF